MEHPARLLNQVKTSQHHPGLLDVVPLDAGPRLTTFRGGAVHCVRPPHSEIFRAPSHFVSVTLAPAPDVAAAYGGGRLHRFDAPLGMIEITPANPESTWHARSVANYVHIALPPQALQELAEQELGLGRLDLQPLPFGTVDQRALWTARTLKAELSEQAAPNELYVDSLITLFGIHLLRTYAGRSRPQRSARGGLPAAKAKQVRDFLQANSGRKLSVADLARLCDLSPSHFIYTFTRSFGQSPHQYLLQLRLAEAERLLLQGELPIAEVAQLSGFSSQSHLTAAMRRCKGTTPAQIRASR